MNAQNIEFDRLYRFLLEELPKQFSRPLTGADRFGVSEEFDCDEFVASFLMPHNAYNDRIPEAIQDFLRAMDHEWTVFCSFDIVEPFAPDGSLNPCPRFTVTRKKVDGDIDVQTTLNLYGTVLRT